MNRVIKHYPAMLHKNTDNSYNVTFPDFPGCTTTASKNDVCLVAGNVLQSHVAMLVANGIKLPEPTSVIKLSESMTPKVLMFALVQIHLPVSV